MNWKHNSLAVLSFLVAACVPFRAAESDADSLTMAAYVNTEFFRLGQVLVFPSKEAFERSLDESESAFDACYNAVVENDAVLRQAEALQGKLLRIEAKDLGPVFGGEPPGTAVAHYYVRGIAVERWCDRSPVYLIESVKIF